MQKGSPFTTIFYPFTPKQCTGIVCHIQQTEKKN